MKTLRPILAGLALILGLASCDMTPPPLSIAIDQVGYSATTYPQDWYDIGATSKPALTYHFTVSVSGNFAPSDVTSARIYLPDGASWWDLTDNYDAGLRAFDGIFRFDQGTEIPVGVMAVELVLSDGTLDTASFRMGFPGTDGSSVATGIWYSYAPSDCSPTYPSLSSPALDRAVVNSWSLGPSSVSLAFTFQGDNVNNGRFWFYDQFGSYLGRSPLFRHGSTGAVYGGLNSGGYFDCSKDIQNQALIPFADLVGGDGAVISSTAAQQIAQVRLVAYDGAQYAVLGHYDWYDYRSISSLY